MTRPTVLVTRRIPDDALRRLRRHSEVRLWAERTPPPTEQLLAMVPGVQAVLSMITDKIDAELMDRAGNDLKVISNLAVGFNNIDVAAATERGIRVGNTPDVLTDATADIAVTLMLAAARRVKEASDQVRQGDWLTWEPLGLLGTDLAGRTLGIVGMGRIGMATARRLRGGWGMNILYTARTPKPEAESELAAQKVSLDELMDRSDFVSIHTNLNDETRHLVDGSKLSRMKPTAVLVNTARGEIVDQDALVAALKDGSIAAAGLDVTTPEPLPSTHPLVGLPNCLILPHIGSATRQTRGAMAEIAVDNLIAGLEGRPLRAEVD